MHENLANFYSKLISRFFVSFFAGKEFIGPNLTLAEVRSKDTGDIYCIASNGYQPSVSQKFELTINCKSDFHSVKIELFFCLSDFT